MDISHLGRETDSAYNDMPLIILDNMAEANCTGNFNVLSNLNIGPENVVLVAANNGEMETFMSGSVHQANFELTDVQYCPDLGNRIIRPVRWLVSGLVWAGWCWFAVRGKHC